MRARALPLVLGVLLAGALPSAALAAPTVTEYGGGNGPLAVTAGPDGNVWFVEYTANKIARVTPTGTLTEFSAGLSSNAGLLGITAGPDGNLWFTESQTDRIGRITPAGAITQFSAGISSNSAPNGIVAGPDGNLWFTETTGNRIGRITTAGSVTQFSVGISPARSPWGITVGGDGNLWFTERVSAGGVGRITTGGVVTEFASSGLPTGIASGPDGNVWFAENANPGYIARISPTGALTEFSAGLTHDGGPQDIEAGADGNLYFTESKAGGALGQITPSGLITQFTSGLSAAPTAIAAGGDGNMWFTENAGDRVGRLTVAPAVTTLSPLATSATSATLAGNVTPNAQATSYHFEWGATASYGTSTASTPVGSGSSAQSATASISGLTLGNTYHYRLVATNGSGTTNGQDVLFTAQSQPIVTTSNASPVGQASATLNATVDPNSLSTSYHFEWGPTASYGNQAPAIDAAVGSDTSEHLVGQLLLGLTAGATYHFRVVATNTVGTSLGADRTFTTLLPPPSASTGTAAAVTQTGATLSANVDPKGSPTTYHFDLGPTTDYGSQWPSSDEAVGSDSAPHALSLVLGALDPGATYHYRVVATSAFGVAYGTDESFSTQPVALDPAPVGVAPPPAPGPDAPKLPPVGRPVYGQTATIAAVSGSVLVQLKGSTTFLPLAAASTVPLGTTIDTTGGTVRLTDIRDRGGKPQSATFWGGVFTVGQGRHRHASTVLTLSAPVAGCSTASRHTASAGATSKKERHLWGRDDHGRFVTRGRSAVATVRGTAWFMRDDCAGTFVKVSRGSVSVRDLVRHRTIIVSSGHSYLARRG
jgi:streptogramin lyase